MTTFALVVEDPATPAWQRALRLSRPLPKSGWDIIVAFLLLGTSITTMALGLNVAATVSAVLLAALLAYRAAREHTSRRRSITVWSESVIGDLLEISERPGHTDAELWSRATAGYC